MCMAIIEGWQILNHYNCFEKRLKYLAPGPTYQPKEVNPEVSLPSENS